MRGAGLWYFLLMYCLIPGTELAVRGSECHILHVTQGMDCLLYLLYSCKSIHKWSPFLRPVLWGMYESNAVRLSMYQVLLLS